MEFNCPSDVRKWTTPKRISQSLSSTISPNGRYFYIVYLFGLVEIDTKNGTETYYRIHRDQEMLEQPEFNICGFVSISDDVGYTIERTDAPYGNYSFRRIEFGHRGDFSIENNPQTVASHVKCLTVCYDFQVNQNELHVILRKEAEEQINHTEIRVWCCFKLQDNQWIEPYERIDLKALSTLNSWDLFPKFHKNSLYVFPVQPCSVSVFAKLQQFNQIARVDARTGALEMISVKSPLEKWASDLKYDNSLFVDNMDYKWIENVLYLMFIVVLQNEDRRSFFENHLAIFSMDKMEWREIHLNGLCRGELSLNPYRMQVTPDNRLSLLVPSSGHPCTTFGVRPYTQKKRLLWKPLVRNLNEIQMVDWYDDMHSFLYTFDLGNCHPRTLINIVENAVHRIYPQLKGREFCEFESILFDGPAKKRFKQSNKLEEGANDELPGDGFCYSISSQC